MLRKILILVCRGIFAHRKEELWVAISKEELERLCDARVVLCNFCEVQECEKCIVTMLIDDAYAECVDCEDD